MSATTDVASLLARLHFEETINEQLHPFGAKQQPHQLSRVGHRPPLSSSLSVPESFYLPPFGGTSSQLVEMPVTPEEIEELYRRPFDRRSLSVVDAVSSSSSSPAGRRSSMAVDLPCQTTSTRYKTELCRPFEEHGTCRYGSKCQFAHGRAELRTVSRHPKYKTDLCRTFHSTGLCPYGPRCHFIHNEEIDGVAVQPQEPHPIQQQQQSELERVLGHLQQQQLGQFVVDEEETTTVLSARIQRQRSLQYPSAAAAGWDLQVVGLPPKCRRPSVPTSLFGLLEPGASRNVSRSVGSTGPESASSSASSISNSPSPSPTNGLLGAATAADELLSWPGSSGSVPVTPGVGGGFDAAGFSYLTPPNASAWQGLHQHAESPIKDNVDHAQSAASTSSAAENLVAAIVSQMTPDQLSKVICQLASFSQTPISQTPSPVRDVPWSQPSLLYPTAAPSVAGCEW